MHGIDWESPDCIYSVKEAIENISEIRWKEDNSMIYNPQLETFIQVADAGSFNRAAEKMYISATAVIKQINSLESNLGLQLFDRTHRGLVLTKAGKSMYQDAKYIVQYSKESVERAREAM